jgi:hypothetical protein
VAARVVKEKGSRVSVALSDDGVRRKGQKWGSDNRRQGKDVVMEWKGGRTRRRKRRMRRKRMER